MIELLLVSAISTTLLSFFLMCCIVFLEGPFSVFKRVRKHFGEKGESWATWISCPYCMTPYASVVSAAMVILSLSLALAFSPSQAIGTYLISVFCSCGFNYMNLIKLGFSIE